MRVECLDCSLVELLKNDNVKVSTKVTLTTTLSRPPGHILKRLSWWIRSSMRGENWRTEKLKGMIE